MLILNDNLICQVNKELTMLKLLFIQLVSPSPVYQHPFLETKKKASNSKIQTFSDPFRSSFMPLKNIMHLSYIDFNGLREK